MPTENPKVSAYVPQTIYNHLLEFKAARSLSISQSVIAILEEYFKLGKVDDTTQRLEVVEGK